MLAGIVCRQSAKGVNALCRGTPRSLIVGQQDRIPGEGKAPAAGFRLDNIFERGLQRLHHGMSMAHKIAFRRRRPPAPPGEKTHQTDGQHSQGGTHFHAAPKRGIDFGIVETLARSDLRFQVAIPLL